MSLSEKDRAIVAEHASPMALKSLDAGEGTFFGPSTLAALLQAAREEASGAGEPVAWVDPSDVGALTSGNYEWVDSELTRTMGTQTTMPLYTSPPNPQARIAALEGVTRDLRDRLLAFVGAVAEITDCGPDVDAIKRADALLNRPQGAVK